MADVSALHSNYLTALLSSEKLPNFPMPPKVAAVAPPTSTTANAGPVTTPKPRKPRSDKGVSKSKSSTEPSAQVPASPPATPKKRKSPPTPTAVADAAGEEAKPKKKRAKKQEEGGSVPNAQPGATGESKPKKPRAKKAPAADSEADSGPVTNGHTPKLEGKKHVLEISAKDVRLKGMKNNPLDKIKSVNAPPTDESSNVLLPGYPTIGSIFAEVYSTHRTVDNRLNSFGDNLTKFMAAQYATNQELKQNYERALEKMQEMHRQDSHTGQDEQKSDDNSDDQQYSNIDELTTITPLTP